jgi:hypothetical protein
MRPLYSAKFGMQEGLYYLLLSEEECPLGRGGDPKLINHHPRFDLRSNLPSSARRGRNATIIYFSKIKKYDKMYILYGKKRY